MFSISLLALTLWGGVLVEPFRVADHQPGHNQRQGCAAMTSDGHFAVAWVDGIASGDPDDLDDPEQELFIRFFDRDGNPMTDPYKITKLADTSWIRHPCLEMDTVGNTILLWEERKTQGKEEPSYVRFQHFAPDGSPVGSAHTLVARALLGEQAPLFSPIDLSLNNNEEFVVTWCEIELGPPTYKNYVWVERFDLEGDPKNRPFLACDEECVFFYYPRVALSDAGDVAVTWRDQLTPFYSDTAYLRFQVFDVQDEPILSWRSRGHLLDYEEHDDWDPQFFWLDNDRFVAFWRRSIDLNVYGLVGEVFTHRGLARHPIRLVMIDPHEVGAWEKMFSVAFFADGRFAETHLRRSKLHENWWWERPGGIIGEIRDNEPWRQTNLFEYTLPFEKDTAQGINPVWMAYFVPAVGVCDDRIVWVYPHSTPDSLCEAWAMITDWDMGVGVAESPIHTASPIQLSASLNRLSYDVSGSVTGEAKLTLYSADGRMVLEETIKGEGIWTPSSLPSGVYFARVKNNSASARAKLVILH